MAYLLPNPMVVISSLKKEVFINRWSLYRGGLYNMVVLGDGYINPNIHVTVSISLFPIDYNKDLGSTVKYILHTKSLLHVLSSLVSYNI